MIFPTMILVDIFKGTCVSADMKLFISTAEVWGDDFYHFVLNI